MRQVCKRLNETSRLWEVWLSQHRQYVAEKEFQPTMEEPLESYSCEELEHWVLERRGADQEWALPGRSVRERTISVASITSPLFLVPGGRWLLRSMPDGSVMCHDLDHHEIRSSILIPSRDHPSETSWRLAIDIDHAAPRLKFNLVTYPSNYL
ncbi:hypothetical protein C0993_012637, partial [Termitomyces sp. T159_Od127]